MKPTAQLLRQLGEALHAQAMTVVALTPPEQAIPIVPDDTATPPDAAMMDLSAEALARATLLEAGTARRLVLRELPKTPGAPVGGVETDEMFVQVEPDEKLRLVVIRNGYDVDHDTCTRMAARLSGNGMVGVVVALPGGAGLDIFEEE